MRILLAEDEISMSRALTAILNKNNYSVLSHIFHFGFFSAAKVI